MSKARRVSKPEIVKKDNNPVSLSSADICKIIKQCRSNGVLSLTLEGLEIHLSEAERKPIRLPHPIPVAPPDPEELPLAAHKRDPFEGNESLENEANELMISDPEAYEALMRGEDAR